MAGKEWLKRRRKMVDMSKIFNGSSTDIMALLMVLVDPSIPLVEKKIVWNKWRYQNYNPDELMEFFSDSLFEDGGFRFLDIVCNNDYKNFYEMAMSLDMANFDPKAYYLYWILGYGHAEKTQLVKDAFDYDPDVILSLIPDFKEIILED